jgi:Uma2 family endonuclease
MSTAIDTPIRLHLSPAAAGSTLAPSEFDAADFEQGFRYELIKGVLVVSPATSMNERDPNEELGYWLRDYRDHHHDGKTLDLTLPEHHIIVGDDRRRADRAIWVRLGRLPQADETPTIAVEFVSAGKRNLLRDYEQKRVEYERVGIREYWVFNRFDCTLTVFGPGGQKQVFREDQVYMPALLPGFEVPLARLFELANRWDS